MTYHQIRMKIKSYNEEPAKDSKHYKGNTEIPHLSHQKSEAKGEAYPDKQQPLVHPAVPEEHAKKKKEGDYEAESDIGSPDTTRHRQYLSPPIQPHSEEF